MCSEKCMSSVSGHLILIQRYEINKNLIFFEAGRVYIFYICLLKKSFIFIKKRLIKLKKKMRLVGARSKNEMNMLHCNIGNMIWNSAVYFKLSKKYW